MTTHFTFFESYYTSVKELDSETKAEFYEAIFEYALYDVEPTSTVSPIVKALFSMAKPNLDSSKAKREAGKQGGSKPKANLSKPKQTPSDKEKEKDKKRDKEVRKFIPPTLNQVKEYQLDKCNNVDADYFFEFFSSSNWVDSKGNKVKSWKQKMLSWNKGSYTKQKSVPHIGYANPAMRGYN